MLMKLCLKFLKQFEESKMHITQTSKKFAEINTVSSKRYKWYVFLKIKNLITNRKEIHKKNQYR